MLHDHGWENNKLCNQKLQDPKKGQTVKENHQKKSCHKSKRPRQMCMADKK